MKTWTILDILKWTTGHFSEKGIPNPRLDAELLLAHALNCNRLQLYLQYQKPLSTGERDTIRSMVIRRSKREPLQYIIGSVEFCDLNLRVTPAVLIPRHETEHLVSLITEKMQSPASILDIGTGSGAIAIALAKHYPEARVTAVDISDDALGVAVENASTNGVCVEFIRGDLFPPTGRAFDVIVSNPPYITEEEYRSLQPEIVGFEPKIALVAENNGYRCYRNILQSAGDYLNPGGLIFFEIGSTQFETVKEIARVQGFVSVDVLKDYNDFNRYMVIGR